MVNIDERKSKSNIERDANVNQTAPKIVRLFRRCRRPESLKQGQRSVEKVWSFRVSSWFVRFAESSPDCSKAIAGSFP